MTDKTYTMPDNPDPKFYRDVLIGLFAPSEYNNPEGRRILGEEFDKAFEEMKTILTVEESARLIELGVDKKLANILPDLPECDKPEWGDIEAMDKFESQCVYSLESLLSILPKKITDRRKVYNLTMGVNSEDLWYAKYMNIHNCCDELDSYHDAHELCDCIYDMIVWLKENPELVWL